MLEFYIGVVTLSVGMQAVNVDADVLFLLSAKKKLGALLGDNAIWRKYCQYAKGINIT